MHIYSPLRFSSALAVIFSLTTLTAAQPIEELADTHITRSTALETHLRFLASDELMGRMTGRIGNLVAARYIAEHFRAAGVRELPGAEGYFQKIPEARLAHLFRGNASDEADLNFLGTHNVAGVIRGSDPAKRDEYVVLMAHYDHIGTMGQRKTLDPDSIFNGARDNGMGTVALIHAAYTLAEKPPARSIILLAVTAEEVGLIGSHYYVENPLIPLEQTVFTLNADGAGFTDTTIVTVIGLERTTATEAIMTGAEAAGLEAAMDPVPDQNLFERSDNVRFARAGIPAPTFSPGFRAFDAELMYYYHQTTDEVGDDFDYRYLTRFCEAYVLAARNIADMEERPYWEPGDVYEAAAEALYGDVAP